MKKLTSLLMSMIMLISFISIVHAAAPPVPAPIIGKLTLNGQGLDGYIIDVTNVRTGKTVSGDTKPSLVTENGGFFVDLSKLGFIPKSEVYVGDTIKVKARALSDSQATVSFIPIDTPYYFNIAIVSGQQIFVCSDGSQVANANDCPVEEEEEEEEEAEVVVTETKVTASSDKSGASLNVNYGQPFDIKLDDSKISKLLDMEVRYDGEKYDIKEEIYVKGVVKTSVDDEDFGLNPYLTIKEGDIEYRYIFEDQIEVTDFHLEEPYDLTFLGRELKIIEASDTEIVLRSGVELFLQEGKSATVEGYKVEVITIGENSILISVDGVQEIVQDGEDRSVGELRVLVESILYKNVAGATNSVELVVGSETDETIKDGDDFELFEKDAEDYSWVISLGGSDQYIGIVNQEEYKNIDDDEDYKAIGVGGVLALPNDYVSLKFDSVSEFDMTELSFKVKDKDGQDYLYVKGDSDDAFNFGSTDYDRLYINSVGIYDEDLVLITTDKVEIGDSDIFLELGSVLIANLKIELDMSDISFLGVSLAGDDESFLDYLGIIFKDPENGVDDQSGFEVSVPEDRPEVLITFTAGLIISTETIVDDEEEEEEGDTGVVTPPIDDVVPPVTPPVLPPVVEYVCTDGSTVTDKADCPVTPEPESEDKWGDTLFEKLLSLVAINLGALGVQWKRGILGIVLYHWKAGRKAQAMKTLFTLVKNAKAGKYNKG